MKKVLFTLSLLAALLVPWATQAQLLSSYSLQVDNVTYSSIRTTGTQLTFDDGDDAAAIVNMPFSFWFGSDVHVDSLAPVSVTTNGYILLDTTGITTYRVETSNAWLNVINPIINYDGDMGMNANAGAYYKVVNDNHGSPESLIIEYYNLAWHFNDESYLDENNPNYGHFSYQIVLHRNGNIEIIYDQVDLGDIPVDEEDGDIRVFLRSGLNDDMLQLAGAWANPTIATNPSDLMDNDVLPVSGLRYTFVCPPAPQCAPISHLDVTYYGTSVVATWRTHRAENPYTAVQLTVSGVDGSNPVTYTTSADWSEQGRFLIPNLQANAQYLLKAKTICGDTEGDETSIIFTPFCLKNIGDGGATSINYLPMNTCYNYALTQQLFRSYELGASTSIDSLALYFYSDVTYSRELDIYLANTSDTVLTSYLPESSFTQVYSGTYTFNHGWNVFHIQPFARNANDNLVFMVHDNNGSYSCTYYFAGHAVTDPSLYQYTDSAPYDLTAMGSGSTTGYRNDIIFYVDGCTGTECESPRALLLHVDTTHATFVVAPGGQETSWQMQYRVNGTVAWSEVQVISAENPYVTLENLTAGGCAYEIRFGTVCDENVLWYSTRFTTKCGQLHNLPYTYGFEDVSGTSSNTPLNMCWYVGRGTSTYPYAYPSTTHATGTYGLYMYTAPNYPPAYIAMPAVGDEIDLSRTFLTFKTYKSSSSYGPIIYGVMKDPADVSTFTALGAINPPTYSQWFTYEVPLTSYHDSGRYVALMVQANGTSYNYMYVDDIELNFLPVCPDVKNIEVTPYAKTAVVTWELRPSLQMPTSGTLIVTNTETEDEVVYSLNEVQISSGLLLCDSLSPLSNYTVQLRMMCEDGEGALSLPVSFRTTCPANAKLVTTGSTTTTPYLPSYHFYRYGYTQSLYRSSELAGVDVVTKIGFNMSTANVSDARVRTIWLAAVDDTAMLNGFVDISDDAFVQVYNGEMLIETGWNEIPLSQNFVRPEGKSILVVTLDNTGSYTSSYYYAAHTTPVNTSVYLYTDGSPYDPSSQVGSGTQTTARPDIRFYGDCDYSLCMAPAAVMIDHDFTTATFHVGSNDNNETFVVQYFGGTQSDWQPADAATISSTSADYTLTGLESGTAYMVRFGSVCDTDTFWYNVPFATACDVSNPGFREDFQFQIFDDPARQMPCWTFSGAGATSCTYTNVTDETRMLFVPQGTYVALPAFSQPASSLFLRFRYLSAGLDSIAVGLMEEPNNMASYTEVAKFALHDEGMAENFFVNFSNVDASGEYIAIYTYGGDSYIDNVSVDFAPSCPDPTNLRLVGTTANSVSLSWDANGTPQNWLVEYGPVNFRPGTGTCVTASTNTNFLLGNLDPRTRYDVYVYNQCSPSDTSMYTNPLTVQTDCAAITSLPYTQGFENLRRNVLSSYTNRMPECWTYDMIASTTTTTSLPQVYLANAHTGNKSLRAYYYAAVAMPELSVNMADVELRFWHYTSSIGYGVIVGVVDSITPGFAASFTPVDTLLPTTTGYKQERVYMAAYQGTGKYIAFRNLYSTYPSYTYGYMYLDDVELLQAPSCLPVRDIHLSTLTTTSADLYWRLWNPNASAQYEIEYGAAGFTQGSGTTLTANTTATTLTGLTPSSTYDVYVRANCGSDASEWTKFTFTTDCNPQPVPFYEGFDSVTVNTLPDCWHYGMEVPFTASTYLPRAYTSNPMTAPHSLYLYYRSVTALPTFETRLDSLMLSFNNYVSSTSYALVVGYVKHNGPGLEETFVPLDTVNTDATGRMDNLYYLNLYLDSAQAAEAHNIAFRNFYNSTYYYPYSYQYIDDINVEMIPDCVAPYRVHMTENTGNTITLDWTDVRPAVSYEIEYGEVGFTQGEGTVITSNTHPVVVPRLTSLSRYDFYVRGVCSENTYSDWSNVYTAGTDICVVPTYVATYDTNDTTLVLTTSSYLPGYSFYNYSYTQTLFDSTELSALAGPINGFDFYATTSTGGDYFHNCTIYMGNTDKEQFTGTDWVIIDSASIASGQFVKVFTGDLTYTEGRNLFGFDTTFEWDGHSNVVMAIKRDNGSYLSGSQFEAVQDPTGMYRSLYIYRDGSAYDPATISGGTRTNMRMRTHLYSCGPDCMAPEVTSSEATYESLTLNWYNMGNAVEANIMPVGSSDWSETETTTESSFTFTDLQPATEYWVRIRQLCDADIDLWSEWDEFIYVTDSLPCFAPTGVNVASMGFRTATIAWTAGTTESQWNVHVWNTANDWTYTTSDNPYTITGLQPGIEYNVAVNALCGNNGELASDYSDTITFTTDICDVVTNVAVSVDGTTATVTWTAGANNSGNWEVNYGYEGFSVGEGDFAQATTTTATLTNLAEETSYDVYVHALCEDGVESNWSTKVSFMTGNGGSNPPTTGIDDVNGSMEVNLYPNPARQSTTIRISGAEGKADVKIVDVTGRTVYTETVDCGDDCVKTVDVNNLAQGTYFVSITSNGVKAVKKLIVK